MKMTSRMSRRQFVGGAASAAKLTACVADPFKSAFNAVGSIKANVDVSVEVQASASASAKTN